MNKWQELNLKVDDWDNLIALSFIDNFKKMGDGNFCDVGACNGIFTKFFSQITKKQVYSFEMNPNNFNHLSSIVSANCIIENLAVCNEDGEVNFYSEGTSSGNHLSNIVGYDANHREMIPQGKVKSIKLDSYFDKIDVDYIKIDVEGAELEVLKGGINTLKRCKFAIIECHYDKDWAKIVDFCKSNGLKFKNLVDDEDIYYTRNATAIPGRSSNGRTYQMYIKNNF